MFLSINLCYLFIHQKYLLMGIENPGITFVFWAISTQSHLHFTYIFLPQILFNLTLKILILQLAKVKHFRASIQRVPWGNNAHNFEPSRRRKISENSQTDAEKGMRWGSFSHHRNRFIFVDISTTNFASHQQVSLLTWANQSEAETPSFKHGNNCVLQFVEVLHEE